MELKNEAVTNTSGAGGSQPKDLDEQPTEQPTEQPRENGNEHATETKLISDEDKAVAALLSGMAKEPVKEEERTGNQRTRRSTRRKKNHLYKDYETDFNKLEAEEVQEDNRVRRTKIAKTQQRDISYNNNGVQSNQFGLLQHLLNGRSMAQPKAALPNRSTIAKFIESFEKQRREAQNRKKNSAYPPAFMGARQGNSAFFVPQQRLGASPAALTAQMMQNVSRPQAATGEASPFPQNSGINELIESLRNSLSQPPQHGGYEQQVLQFASQGVQRPISQQEPISQIQELLGRLQQQQQQQNHVAPRSARAFTPLREWQESPPVGANPNQPSVNPLETMMAAMAGTTQPNGERTRNQPAFTAPQAAGTQTLQGQSALRGDNVYMSKFNSLLQSLGALGDRQ